MGGVKIEKEGVALILFRMDDGGASFRVKHGSDEVEVTDVRETGAGEVGDEVGKREMRRKRDETCSRDTL